MYGKKLKLIISFVLVVSLSLPTAVPSLFNVAATAMPNEVIVPGFTPYSKIPRILEELNASNRVLVQVIGQSADGHDLYLATAANPAVLENLTSYKEFAGLTVEDPELAWKLVENGTVDYKATIFITGSIHGDEMMGTDACLDLIELLANGDTEEGEAILDNTISLIYVCVNPDGRIADMRYNGNYFDVNRDWLTASQPEVRAGIEYVFKEWAPLVNIDLHGYWGEDLVLIEPCTPLHNPNAEEDLLVLNDDAHLLPMAEKMEARLKEIGIDTVVPYRDWTAEWDDYTPIFTPMYGFYHGCFGMTFESTDPYDKNGSPEISINAHFTGMLGAYEYIVEYKDEMFEDQTEIFLRGIENKRHWLGGEPGHPESFPYAYILPMDPELQMDPIQAAKIVDFAIFHGVTVHLADDSFTANNIVYPAGTYVVLMNQSRAGLAMNMFWYGEDLSNDTEHPPYDIYAWNFPELWGFNRTQINEPFEAELAEVEEASYPIGGVKGEGEYGYALRDDTNNAVRMVNRLLREDITVYSVTEDAEAQFGVGTFIIPLQEQEDYIIETAESLHLTLFALSEEPAVDKRQIALPKVAILYARGVYAEAYGETQFTLKSLEFDFDVLNYVDVRKAKLENYDIVVVPDGSAWSIWKKLGGKGQRKLLEFIGNGGTYFGVGEGGGALVNYAEFLDADAYRAGWYGGYNNGIVRLDYNQTDPIAAYYPEESYGYAFFPVWFEAWGDVDTVASYFSDDMLLAGWWPDSEDAEGYGAVIKGTYGEGNIILSGVEPTFRAHTEFTFRLVANAIFFAASE